MLGLDFIPLRWERYDNRNGLGHRGDLPLERTGPPELKERAVRMVGEIRGDHESEWAAMAQVAELLGKEPEEIDPGYDELKADGIGKWLN